MTITFITQPALNLAAERLPAAGTSPAPDQSTTIRFNALKDEGALFDQIIKSRGVVIPNNQIPNYTPGQQLSEIEFRHDSVIKHYAFDRQYINDLELCGNTLGGNPSLVADLAYCAWPPGNKFAVSIIQERVMPLDHYLMAMAGEESREVRRETIREFFKLQERILDRGVINIDTKTANYGVRKDGSIVLTDLLMTKSAAVVAEEYETKLRLGIDVWGLSSDCSMVRYIDELRGFRYEKINSDRMDSAIAQDYEEILRREFSHLSDPTVLLARLKTASQAAAKLKPDQICVNYTYQVSPTGTTSDSFLQ